MKRTCLLAIVALVLSAGTETGAFVPLRTSGGVDYAWDLSRAAPNVVGDRVTFYLHPDGSKDLPASEALAAARAALASWGSVEHSALAFTEDPTRPANRRKSGDRVNLIKWVSGELGPFVFGTTWPTYQDGHLVDADILMNEDVQLSSTLSLLWTTQEPGGPRSADIQGVLTHEWGHAIGLDHEAIHGSTMYYAAYAGSTYFRTLHEDDRAAVRTLYPDTDTARETGIVRGTADVAGRTNDRGVHVIAIDADSGEVATARMSEPDGSYAVTGLLPGNYLLVAAPFVRLSTLNDYWSSSATRFLPAVLTATGGNGDYARVIHVRGGDEIGGADFLLENADDPAESNDGPATAFPLRIGDAIAARLESGDDEDWYFFSGTKGQTIDIRVHSLQIGGTADPHLQLLDRGGARVLRANGDVRDPVIYGARVEGPDTDARIASYTLPSTGTYHLRVREEALQGTADHSAFYVLTLTRDPEAPSAPASTYSATPDVIHADGSETSELRVVPHNAMGEIIGEGVAVTFVANGGGTIGPVSYRGGGEYGATLTASLGGPGDSIDVTMTRDGATATAEGALSIRYIGVADGANSDFFAEPRRLPADGVSTAEVTLVPRDATGYPIGPGRTVTFDVGTATGLPAADLGDGSYVTTVTAAAGPDIVTVRASVDGTDLGRELPVWSGFDLLAVVTAVGAEVEDVAVLPGLKPAIAKRLVKAAGKLAGARSIRLVVEGGEVDALKDVVKAAKQIRKAQKKAHRTASGAIDLEPALIELATAARETARAAIDGAPPDGGKRLEQAELKLAAGDAAMGAGKYDRAIRRYRDALRKAVSP
ncbi:MAG: invasin domain 3-containing protein [Planctomycetota bacterium]